MVDRRSFRSIPVKSGVLKKRQAAQPALASKAALWLRFGHVHPPVRLMNGETSLA
jgi:hypothetical protein